MSDYPELKNVRFSNALASTATLSDGTAGQQSIYTPVSLSLQQQHTQEMLRTFVFDLAKQRKAVSELDDYVRNQDVLEQHMKERKRTEALKKSPGLSANGEILKPTNASSLHETDPSIPSKTNAQSNLNYLEFEHGLSPPDPWESTDKTNDLQLLSEVMGGPSFHLSSDHVAAPPAYTPFSQDPRLPTPTMPSLPIPPRPPIPPRFKTASEHANYTTFVNMGFDSDAVQRAVRFYGQDDKPVLDFVVAFCDYVSKGYPADAVEMALIAYHPAKPAMIVPFLDAFGAISELGFAAPQIRDALLATSNSRQDAIELLMK